MEVYHRFMEGKKQMVGVDGSPLLLLAMSPVAYHDEQVIHADGAVLVYISSAAIAYVVEPVPHVFH